MDGRRKLRQHKRAVTIRDKKRITNILESTSKPKTFGLLHSTHHTWQH